MSEQEVVTEGGSEQEVVTEDSSSGRAVVIEGLGLYSINIANKRVVADEMPEVISQYQGNGRSLSDAVLRYSQFGW